MLFVDQSSRHGSNGVALVCSTWTEAVNAAEVDVLVVHRCADVENLQRCIHKRGQQLQRLQLHSVRGLSELPCPHLQQLSLRSCEFDITAGSSCLTSSLSTATALTSLHINKCRMLFGTQAEAKTEAAHLMSALASLTGLQELSVCGVCCTGRDTGTSVPLLVPATFLQPLQHLTQLHLQAQPQADVLVQHIGSMTDLRDLRLGGVPDGLLQLHGAHAVPTRGVQQFTPLRLDAAQLTALTQLVRLGVRGVSLCRGGCTRASKYECQHCFSQASAANAAALLAWLHGLQGLSSLQLRGVQGLCTGQQQHAALYPPPAAFKALTAGSALQHIDLRGTFLTRNAWQRAFPSVQKFTSITSLRSDLYTHRGYRGEPSGSGCLTPELFCFQSAIDSCPNLQELHTHDRHRSWEMP